MGGSVLSAAMIAWAQSQIEGIPADKYKDIAEGLIWRWNGEPLALAGRPGTLLLTEAMARSPRTEPVPEPAAPLLTTILAGPEHGSAFVVTDGARVYSGLPVLPGSVDAPLLVFHDGLPPSATDLRILQAEPTLLQPAAMPDEVPLLCVTPGTRIATPNGDVLVEDLGPGDAVLTQDSGPQEITWMGHRRLSGARLFAYPAERPVRIRTGALGDAGPTRDLVVSPDHSILVRDGAARALWGEDEVLVRARDLVGRPGIRIDHRMTETYYITLMLDCHEVLWANGAAIESFHPGPAGLAGLAAQTRQSLLDVRPDLAADPYRFGPTARRVLGMAEAELLGHGLRRPA